MTKDLPHGQPDSNVVESDEAYEAREKAESELARLDYYTLLRVARDATPGAIKAAFHQFALKFHPDRHHLEDQARQSRAHAIYRRGAEAYRVLTDSDRRAQYDASLAKGVVRLVETEREMPKPKPGELVIKSLAARPFFQRALEAMTQQDWKTAKLNLSIACTHEADNPALRAKLTEVEDRLKAKQAAKP